MGVKVDSTLKHLSTKE